MKIKIDYELLHCSISKLKNNEVLNQEDKENILLILTACEGDYYPTKEELAAQMHRVKLINQIEPSAPDADARILRLVDLCADYENKYL